MNEVDVLGYAASALVLATFCTRDMVSLRVLAIASNLAFFGYAALAGIYPVLALHALLLPMNVWRLREAAQRRDGTALEASPRLPAQRARRAACARVRGAARTAPVASFSRSSPRRT